MKSVLLLILLLNVTAAAQYRWEVKKGLPTYDLSYEVEKCESDYCYGALQVWLNKKGRKEPFQEFKLETEFAVEAAQKPLNSVAYRDQYVVKFTDVNFDGAADLAIQNGREGGYSGPSYSIYLWSPGSRKFVHNPKLSSLATGPYLGMFEVDRKKKLLRTSSKSGCCMHETEEYKVVKGRVVKVFSEFEDATIADEKRVRITTKKLVGGKWKTSVKYVKRVD
jgi:hypothetical protein